MEARRYVTGSESMLTPRAQTKACVSNKTLNYCMNFELELISLDCKHLYDRNSDTERTCLGNYIFM